MSTRPLPYTTHPLILLQQDIKLFFSCTFDWSNLGLISIVWPLWSSNPEDELALTWSNAWAIGVHTILIFLQLAYVAFALSAPFFGLPALVYFAFLIGGVQLNKFICNLTLNGLGEQRVYYAGGEFARNSNDEVLKFVPNAAGQEGERWVFINGVAVGSHWMDCNLRRIAQTFRRPVRGIRNTTYGIIFDVLECVIQRTFAYPTLDIRTVYLTISALLKQEDTKKLVLIAHSQGGIEAGMVLDWLFATLPREQVAKLEVYTFGAAANHFNCPGSEDGDRVIQHIEHYANKSDWVSRFGVLFFRGIGARPNGGLRRLTSSLRRLWRAATGTLDVDILRNRFVGSLFLRDASGHMLNQHYFANMFKTDAAGRRVLDNNPFMDGIADDAHFQSEVDDPKVRDPGLLKSKSRLWQYRNGGVPTS